MEWLYACRGCGAIVESFQTLNAAGEHSFCKTCLLNRDADLSDFVESGFTVLKAVRTSRFYDPESLSAKELLSTTTISANAVAREGTKAAALHFRASVLVTDIAS